MADRIKILIVGGSGFVGSSLTRAFVKKDYQVFSTYHRSYTPVKGAHYVPLPTLSEKDRCDRLIRSTEPNVLIYCLGTNSEAEAEKDPKKAQMIHSNSVTHLIHASEMSKAKFIYISSDQIFSGLSGNFFESDSTIPSSSLGKAKAGAESLVKTRSLNHLIIRCAPLLGRGPLDHPSWLDQIRDQIVHQKKVSFQSKQIRNPVHVSFLSEVLHRAIQDDLKNKFLHVAGLTKISMHELAFQFLKKIELPTNLLEVSDPESVMQTDYSLNFSETLKLVETQPLFLEQSFDLFQ